MTFAAQIVDLDARIANEQKHIDWFNNVNGSYGFMEVASLPTYTNVDGKNGYWAQWRLDNPSLDGSNGTDDENMQHFMWDEHQNDTTDWTSVKTTMQASIDSMTADRNHLQSNIDNGNPGP